MNGKERQPSRYFGRNLTNLPSKPLPLEYLCSQDKPVRYEEQLTVRQPHLMEMRRILVQWMCEVHQKFKLCQETLFIAVGIMDRVMYAIDVPAEQLQLLCSTALWVAAKYEEIYPPHLKYFAEVSDGAFTKIDVLRMEETIIKSLNFKVTFPTRSQMLLAELEVRKTPVNRLTHLAQYLLELSLVQPWDEKQQDVARGALYLASRILKDTSVFPESSADWRIKTIGYRLAQYLGHTSIGCKYDTEVWCFVGGIVLETK